MIELTLPYPPSINHYWRNAYRTGQTYISEEGQQFRHDVGWLIAVSRRFAPSDRLIMEIDAYMPDARQRDLDNLIKPTWDALQHGGLFANDEQIDKLTLERHEIVAGGKLRVRIWKRGAEAPGVLI